MRLEVYARKSGGVKEGCSCICGSGEGLQLGVDVRNEEENALDRIERPITALRV